MSSAGRTELIFIIFMMIFLFIFGCLAVFVFIRQYRREKLTPKQTNEPPKSVE